MTASDRVNPRAAFALVLCGTVLGIAGTDLILPAIPGLPAILGVPRRARPSSWRA